MEKEEKLAVPARKDMILTVLLAVQCGILSLVVFRVLSGLVYSCCALRVGPAVVRISLDSVPSVFYPVLPIVLDAIPLALAVLVVGLLLGKISVLGALRAAVISFLTFGAAYHLLNVIETGNVLFGIFSLPHISVMIVTTFLMFLVSYSLREWIVNPMGRETE